MKQTTQSKQENAKKTDAEIKQLLRDALVSALNQVKEKNNQMKQPSLSDADYEKLAQSALAIYENELVKARKKLEIDEKAEQKRI